MTNGDEGGIGLLSLIGIGGVAIATASIVGGKSESKNRANTSIRQIQQERDRFGEIEDDVLQRHIDENKQMVRLGLDSIERQGDCNKPLTMSDAEANAPGGLAERSLYWKQVSVRVNSQAAACQGIRTDDIVRRLLNLGMVGILAMNAGELAQAAGDIIDRLRGGDGGEGGGPGGGTQTDPDGGDQTEEPSVSADAGEAVEAIGLPTQILSLIGVSAGTSIALGADALEAIAGVTGKSIDFFVERPLIAVGLALIMIVAAITLASPIPGDEIVAISAARAYTAATGIALPGVRSLARVGKIISV